MKRIFVFDLYDTVLTDISFSFLDGLKYLHDNFFISKCSFDELNEYSETFLPLYEKRKTQNVEICLIKDEIPFYFNRFGVDLPSNIDDLEYTVMNIMQKVYLEEPIKNTIRALYDNNVEMYILSNSIFRGVAAERLLKEHSLLQYFKALYSSADYGIRKPDKKFFDIAVDEVIKNNPGYSRNSITYIGNDYRSDVHGGLSAGLKTIWYNVKSKENVDKVDCQVINDFSELLKFI